MRVVFGVVFGLMAALPAAAAPLDIQACGKLKQEQAQLVERGARAALDAGPQAVAARLSQQQLQDVRRLLTVDEQLLFRCPQPPPPKPVAAEPGTAPPRPKPKPRQAAAGDEPAVAAEAAKPKQQSKPAAAAASVAEEQPKRVAKPAAPKPRTDDAYKPPG